MNDLLNWLWSLDPTTRLILLLAAGVSALILLAAIVQRIRQSAVDARRRAELRRTMHSVELQQQEIERLSTRIIATSSTPAIAGFEIVRQIEAVFADGHPSPEKAVMTLKALAAQKGANAIINLESARQPGGKCFARGDVVIVKPLPIPVAQPPARPQSPQRPPPPAKPQ
jgi:hypothetical protein